MNIDAPSDTQIPALKRLWYEAFDDTEEFIDSFFRTAFHIDRCRVVTTAGEVVAALYWFDCLYNENPVAYLYSIATARTYQGQGICHKLIEETHLHLTELGYKGVILVPGSKALFKLYESIGYCACCCIKKIFISGSKNMLPFELYKDKITLRRINQFEYAVLRRQMLPKGSIIQENENLDFLQTQAAFYTGHGFLLAARKEFNILYGMELLGNSAIAPHLTYALGCKKGIFRTPGLDNPFAMYHPLDDSNLLPPTYFGLAFD